MAVPSSISTHSLSGTYNLNKALSDSSVPVLKQQGVGFLVRQAAQYSNITIAMKQYTDEATGKERIDFEQTSTGGMKSSEERVMDGEWRAKEDKIWGKVKGASEYVKLSSVEDEFLREGWAQDCVDGDVIRAEVHSVSSTWTALQIWGFADVDGERKHVRKVLAKKGDEALRIRLVYDWQA